MLLPFVKEFGRKLSLSIVAILGFVLLVIILPFYYFFEISPAIKAVTYENALLRTIPLHPQAQLKNKGMLREEIGPEYLYEAEYAIDSSTPTSEVIEYYTHELDSRGWTRIPGNPTGGYIVYNIPYNKDKEAILLKFECKVEQDLQTSDIRCVKSRTQDPLLLKVRYQNHLYTFQRIPDYLRILTGRYSSGN